jgi:hypothetical protein
VNASTCLMLVGRFLRHHWFAKIKDCEAPPISRLAEYRRELSQLIIIRSPRKYVTESPADQRDLVRGARGRFYNALDLINRLKIHRTMQIKRAVKALLFDLGTLTDPKPGIAACIQHAMRALGHQAPHVDDLASTEVFHHPVSNLVSARRSENCLPVKELVLAPSCSKVH